MMTTLHRLREKARALPLSPGVYLMKNKVGTVIYVGKSRKLRMRVSQYFTEGEQAPKTRRMVAAVFDFDYIVCGNEVEALSLENTLIKKYAPRYNIKLKDAKSYPYIAITSEAFPRVIVTRSRKNDGSLYFGPYPSSSEARTNAETVSRIFRLPKCRHRFPEETGKMRPCLYHQMNRCLAPCLSSCDREAYKEAVFGASQVLSGHVHKIAEDMKKKMLALAENEQFEAAARYRDAIAALKHLGETQRVVDNETVFMDIWAMASQETAGALSLLSVRGGALNRKHDFTFPGQELLDEERALDFIAAYYGEHGDLPQKVLLSFAAEEESVTLLADYLSGQRGKRVSVLMPKKGRGRALCDMAEKNAEEAIDKYSQSAARDEKTALSLAKLLALEVVPSRIEMYDISSLGSEETTAGMVVWEEGKMRRNQYRLFRIKTVENDDYGAMREVLSRRFAHQDDQESFGIFPDLILLDGGKGHVHVGREVLNEMGLDIPLFGLVKNDKHKTEALQDGENNISFERQQDVYMLLYQLQEEVHRFSVGAVMRAKTKKLRTSSLEHIEGIGKERAKLLLDYFGNLRRVKSATLEELSAVKGMTKAAALAVYLHYHPQKEQTT